ncbi:MAG: phosphotransferase [Planctomycetes bacterium]|nr:phosphotransferase [Planctomycetota bacterium]
MIHWQRAADGALWRLCASTLELGEAARQQVARKEPAHETAEACVLGDHEAWRKGGALKGKASLRHGVRLRLFQGLPRLREAANLEWLAAHLFEVPRPLAAVARIERGLPRGQWLWAARLAEAAPLEERWPLLPEQVRDAVLEELAREVARMHALGFVHRDLFVRNLMHRVGSARQLVFLDCWRGGPGWGLRGPAWDAGCLLSDLVDWAGDRAAARWLEAYLAERSAQDRPVRGEGFVRQALAARAAVIRRLIRQPERLRGRAMPTVDWRP